MLLTNQKSEFLKVQSAASSPDLMKPAEMSMSQCSSFQQHLSPAGCLNPLCEDRPPLLLAHPFSPQPLPYGPAQTVLSSREPSLITPVKCEFSLWRSQIPSLSLNKALWVRRTHHMLGTVPGPGDISKDKASSGTELSIY